MSKLFDAKPYIIAEIGSNFDKFDHCLKSISGAKEAGADAVKFQVFDYRDLFGYQPYKSQAHPMSRIRNWMDALAEKAEQEGIEFLCTAFSPELVRYVDAYVPVHKIASSDLNYPQLLDAVAKTGKPILLSTGASTKDDILQALKRFDGRSVTLLYCVAAYPARTIDLSMMTELRDFFGLPVGFSDHSTDIFGHPLAAAKQGAVVIEKHVTFFPKLYTADRTHSLTAVEFRQMVDRIRRPDSAEIGPTTEESAMVLRHRRRLVASKYIGIGETLRYGDNYGAYRTTEDDAHGLSPYLWNHETMGPEGKAAVVAILQGKGIGRGDF